MQNEHCPGRSVGALLKKDGTYLVLDRISFPSGIAGIAGHIDEGETPEQALRREVLEESGIMVFACKEVLHVELHNPCKRGFNVHDWHVFEVTQWQGEPRVMEPDKHSFVGFMTADEIRARAARGAIDPAWKELFPLLGVEL